MRRSFASPSLAARPPTSCAISSKSFSPPSESRLKSMKQTTDCSGRKSSCRGPGWMPFALRSFSWRPHRGTSPEFRPLMKMKQRWQSWRPQRRMIGFILWQTANTKWNATVIQNNFEVQPFSVIGHFSLRHAAASEHYVERLNRLLASRKCARLRGAPRLARAGFRDRNACHGLIHDIIMNTRCRAGPESLVPYAHSVSEPGAGGRRGRARRFSCWTWTTRSGAALSATWARAAFASARGRAKGKRSWRFRSFCFRCGKGACCWRYARRTMTPPRASRLKSATT